MDKACFQPFSISPSTLVYTFLAILQCAPNPYSKFMQLSYLLYLAISGAGVFPHSKITHERHSHTAGTIGTMGMTITAGTTFYITNATATATTASAAPTYNAFTVYRLPCPNNTTLTCCDPNQENNTPTQSGC